MGGHMADDEHRAADLAARRARYRERMKDPSYQEVRKRWSRDSYARHRDERIQQKRAAYVKNRAPNLQKMAEYRATERGKSVKREAARRARSVGAEWSLRADAKQEIGRRTGLTPDEIPREVVEARIVYKKLKRAIGAAQAIEARQRQDAETGLARKGEGAVR